MVQPTKSQASHIETQNCENFNNHQNSSDYKFQKQISPDNFEMINVGKVKYDKTVAFIVNPSSGKSRDQR